MKQKILLATLMALIPKLAWADLDALAQFLAEKPEQVRQLILPSADEMRWREIPWIADLSEARRKAAREGKPILLWEMDGHPLGCT